MKCPVCKGAKVYVGLNTREACSRCRGKGEIGPEVVSDGSTITTTSVTPIGGGNIAYTACGGSVLVGPPAVMGAAMKAGRVYRDFKVMFTGRDEGYVEKGAQVGYFGPGKPYKTWPEVADDIDRVLGVIP